MIPRLITVPGRVLQCPEVGYRETRLTPMNGSWNMTSKQCATGAHLHSWTYLRIKTAPRDAFQNDEHLKRSLDSFMDTLRKIGMTVNANGYRAGTMIELTPNNPLAWDDKIENAIRSITLSDPTHVPGLLLVILPSDNAAIYNRVKLTCDVKVGQLNVCVVGNSFAKINSQYYANVALKVNLKLGGINQYLKRSDLGIIAEDKTMVVGIDVTHPSPGSTSTAPSVSGIVASVNKFLGIWPAAICIQEPGKEMVSALDALLKSRLELWAQNHERQYPENILVYRDGVSESQYGQVLELELPLLRKACNELYTPTQRKEGIPRMTIIVVGKRHHTRFYPTKTEDADQSGNPRNGTVVDRHVTFTYQWDFFLQAHSAIQGTARPAHYFVLLDEIFRRQKVPQPFVNTADVLENLTHNMCYLFGRACRATSHCPASYYADLVCERARRYLSHEFDPTPGNTPAPSVVEGDVTPPPVPVRPDIRIHPRVENTMFYI